MVCPKCSAGNEDARTICRNCGAPLLAGGETPKEGANGSSSVEGTRTVRRCPRCHLQFEVGNYCRRCGSPLERANHAHPKERIPGKKLLKSLSSEWSTLTKQKKEVEDCLGVLEAKQGAVSEDLFHPICRRYQAQLDSLSCRLREIESEREAFKASASEVIESLEEGLRPIRKRFEEIESLHRLGGIIRSDYSLEKNGLTKEMKAMAKRLKESQDILSSLSGPKRGGMYSWLSAGNLLRRRFQVPMIAGGIMILIAAGAYFLWPKTFNLQFKNSPGVPRAESSVGSEAGESEKIKHLFETIRQANLQKRIDLFMSCYASDLKDRNGKRQATLEIWDHYDYLDLSYDFKRQAITRKGAQVRVEWWIKIAGKNGGSPQESKSAFDVTLKKEDDHWKIREIKPVG